MTGKSVVSKVVAYVVGVADDGGVPQSPALTGHLGRGIGGVRDGLGCQEGVSRCGGQSLRRRCRDQGRTKRGSFTSLEGISSRHRQVVLKAERRLLADVRGRQLLQVETQLMVQDVLEELLLLVDLETGLLCGVPLYISLLRLQDAGETEDAQSSGINCAGWKSCQCLRCRTGLRRREAQVLGLRHRSGKAQHEVCCHVVGSHGELRCQWRDCKRDCVQCEIMWRDCGMQVVSSRCSGTNEG